MKGEFLDRKQFEEIEAGFLACYATKSRDSKGRDHQEPEDDLRSRFQRDRDRIVHCNAFRRMEYKTQVFVIHEGDYYRTRLTHTMEVAQIARSLARTLKLNEDLTEAIALAHDLGHTPFGHSGEEVLDRLMKKHGGKFEHNEQSLRIVKKLEKRYPKFDGLNLTYEVMEGLDKHKTAYDKTGSKGSFGTLEAQVVNLSDEIAYHTHDLDDGIKSNLLKLDELNDIHICQDLLEKMDRNEHPDVKRYQMVKFLINGFCKDLIKQSLSNIEKHGLKSVDDVRKASSEIVSFSAKMEEKKEELRKFLYEKLYKHYRVVRMEVKYQNILEKLFDTYTRYFEHKPENKIYSMLPQNIRTKVDKDNDMYRVICDHIASMTDSYALEEYKKLFDANEKV